MTKYRANDNRIAAGYLRKRGIRTSRAWTEMTPHLETLAGITDPPFTSPKKRGQYALDMLRARPDYGITWGNPDQPAEDDFLNTFEWRKLRYATLQKYGARCQCCGRTPPEVKIHVDHIKPRRKHPELALDPDNLQVLCGECNHGKSNWDETDWRPDLRDTR